MGPAKYSGVRNVLVLESLHGRFSTHILLGAQLTSCRNLTNLKPCQDGDFIRDTVSALHGCGRECLFCNCQRIDRAHWSHDCPASRPELAQKDRNVAACLAFMGFCFWFDPLARWWVQIRIEDLLQCGFTLHDQDPTLMVGPQDRRPDRGMTVPGDRAIVLLGLWNRASTTEFPDLVHRVLKEVVSGFGVGHNVHQAEFDIVVHIPCELRCWFRDKFGLEQEILTTSITASHVFASPPRVLGVAWRKGDWASVSNSPLTDMDAPPAWTRPCLAVLNEHSKGCLNGMFRAFDIAARTTIIVVVLQDPPRKTDTAVNRPWKRTQWASLIGNATGTATHDEIAIFPPQTVLFGHASGWNDDPSAFTGRSHCWFIDKKGTVVPPDEHEPGFLRRHAAALNQRPVRVLLYGPPRDRARCTENLTPQSLRELAYIMGGVGGPGQHPHFVHGGRWLRCQHKQWDLRWNKQMSCGRFDFNLPWVLAQWQPPLLRKLPMPDLAAPRDMQLAQTALYSLEERSTTDMYIPDGVLPTALHRFLTEIGQQYVPRVMMTGENIEYPSSA